MCGVGVAMIAVATGKQEKTVERWIRRIAPHCKRLIEQNLSKQNHSFTSVYLQMDALWSYLWRKKTKVWILAGLDVVTRLLIAFHVGDRSGESAKALVEAIKARIHDAPGLITNFIRPHMSLTLGKGRGKQKRTPAIAAGLTDHI